MIVSYNNHSTESCKKIEKMYMHFFWVVDYLFISVIFSLKKNHYEVHFQQISVKFYTNLLKNVLHFNIHKIILSFAGTDKVFESPVVHFQNK